MEINLEETIAEELFEYGNHVITVTVTIKYTQPVIAQNVLNQNKTRTGYYRKVTVEAYDKETTNNQNTYNTNGDPDVSNTKYAALDVSTKIVEKSHMIFWTKKVKKGTKPTPIQDHIENVVQRVLSKLDEFYTFTHNDVSVNVDVAMEKIKAETSWVDIKQRSNEIAREIDAITETN